MSDWMIIAPFAAATVAVSAVWWRRRRGRAALGLDHVQGVVERLDSLRAAALDRFDEPLTDGDPRAAVTRDGLTLTYRITGDGDRYRHHLSVADGRGTSARSVAPRFLLLGVERLRVEDMQVGLGMSPSGVYHAAWVLDAEGQALFVDRRPAPLDESSLATLFAKCQDEAARVRFEPMAGETPAAPAR